MEISNRSLSIAGVSFLLAFAAVKTYSDDNQASVIPNDGDQVTVASTRSQIQDSPAPYEWTHPGPIAESYHLGTKQMPPTGVSGQDYVGDMSHLPEVKPSNLPGEGNTVRMTRIGHTAQLPSSGQTTQTQAPATNVYIQSYSNGSPGNLADDATVDRMAGLLDPADQPGFYATWATMTPEQRQNMIQTMRTTYGGF